MKGKRPSVAIILVNYNGWKDTLECLESLRSVEYPNYRVFLCDNASTDGSVGALKKKIKSMNVTLLENKKNLGFAGGNNTAIRAALGKGAEYLLLLNNDTTVTEGFLNELVDAAEKDPRIGVVGGKIYYYRDKKKIWAAGGGSINRMTGISKHFGLNESDNPRNSTPREMDYLTGCLMLVRASAIRKVGLMDEKYFLYYEESDWQFRMRRSGYRVLYVPGSRIFHKVSASAGDGTPAMKYYFVRNRIYFIRKNFGIVFRPFALLITRLTVIARIVYHRLAGRKEQSAHLARAMKDGMNGRMGAYRP